MWRIADGRLLRKILPVVLAFALNMGRGTLLVERDESALVGEFLVGCCHELLEQGELNGGAKSARTVEGRQWCVYAEMLALLCVATPRSLFASRKGRQVA